MKCWLAAALLAAPSAFAADTAPPLSEVRVWHVASHDYLNLRADADARAPIVGRLSPDTHGIEIIAQSVTSRDWLKLRANGLEGWANARFLVYDGPGTGNNPLPVRLHCTGTEPFWRLEISYSRADAEGAFEGAKAVLALEPPRASKDRGGAWDMPVARGNITAAEGDFLRIEGKTCSDDMSDRRYPFALAMHVNQRTLSGCCD